MMLHMVFTSTRIESFVQVEHRVIYELRLGNRSVYIHAALKIRLMQPFVARQESRYFLLKQHICFNSSNSIYTSCVADKPL